MISELKLMGGQDIDYNWCFSSRRHAVQGGHRDFCSEVLICPGFVVKAKALGRNEEQHLSMSAGLMQLK